MSFFYLSSRLFIFQEDVLKNINLFLLLLKLLVNVILKLAYITMFECLYISDNDKHGIAIYK